MRVGSVFPEKDPLPRSEGQPPVNEGNRLRRPGESHLDVAGHVVRSLGCVLVSCSIRDQLIKISFQIIGSSRVSVFHDDQAATRVSAEDGY